jgi:hypothetical protein
MHNRQRSAIALLGAFLLFLAAAGTVDSGAGKIESFTEQQPEISIRTADSGARNDYTVPRKQVLLEMATATW